MLVLGETVLTEFCDSLADLRKPAEVWLTKVRPAKWKNPNGLKLTFPAASFLQARRVVFNLKGNRYRLLASLDFEIGRSEFKWLERTRSTQNGNSRNNRARHSGLDQESRRAQRCS
ncbi:MAG: type II toxin-antitoxin system HigB family toxin [Rhodothermia bacterium]